MQLIRLHSCARHCPTPLPGHGHRRLLGARQKFCKKLRTLRAAEPKQDSKPTLPGVPPNHTRRLHENTLAPLMHALPWAPMASRIREIRDRIWTAFGPNLDHIWTAFGPHLDRIWTAFGPLLDRFWTAFRIWTTFGPHLDRIWTAFGPLLDRRKTASKVVRNQFESGSEPPVENCTLPRFALSLTSDLFGGRRTTLENRLFCAVTWRQARSPTVPSQSRRFHGSSSQVWREIRNPLCEDSACSTPLPATKREQNPVL